MGFGMRFLRVLPKMMASCKEFPEELPSDFTAEQGYKNLSFDDMWEDADMESVLIYLKGNNSLKIPQTWRPFLLPEES